MARHSRNSSQRMHSFIFLRLEMTVPKQSFMIRDKCSSGTILGCETAATSS